LTEEIVINLPFDIQGGPKKTAQS